MFMMMNIKMALIMMMPLYISKTIFKIWIMLTLLMMTTKENLTLYVTEQDP